MHVLKIAGLSYFPTGTRIISLWDNGWASLSAIGSMIMKNNPSFDPRNYGCQKLGELVRKQAYLEVKHVKAAQAGDGPANFVLHVRVKTAELPID